MKDVLVVINTLGRAGAETMLMDSLMHTPDDWNVSLFVLTGQGEMVHELPPDVRLLNRQYDDASVLDEAGRRKLAKRVLMYGLHRASVFRNLSYMTDNLIQGLKHGGIKNIKYDKLLWRVMSDGAPVSRKKYDLAVAFIEGGSTYYVADHVKAAEKIALVHVDYEKAGYTQKLDKDCYDRFDRIYAVSGGVKDSFLRVHPECAGRTEVFINTPDRDRIIEKSLYPADFGRFDQNTGRQLDPDAKIIVSVMRLTAQKTVDLSARVCRRLLDDGLNVKWYVFGEGEERKKLEKLIERLDIGDCFFLCGTVDNPYPYMEACDLYVHLSGYEGRSVALQEALILGKKVVVSDTGGNGEILKDTSAGIQVKPDVFEAAAAIERELK